MKRELELSESQKNEIWTERNSIHNELSSLRQSHEALLGEVGSLRRQLQEKESLNDDASNKIIHVKLNSAYITCTPKISVRSKSPMRTLLLE